MVTSPRTRPDAVEPGLLARPFRRAVIGVFLVSTFIAFEQMSVAPILPAVVAHIGGLNLYGWAFSAFMLAELMGIVFAGRLIDRIGCSTPLLVAGLVFTAGLLIDGTAPTMLVLVCGRAVQGFGAGTITVVVNAAVGRALPPRLRPRAFAALAVAWVLPSVVGPAIAGVVAQTLSWRIVFLGVIPAVLVGLVTALPALRESDRAYSELHLDSAEQPGEIRAILLTASLLALGAAASIEATSSRQIPVIVAGGLIGSALLIYGVRRVLPSGLTAAGRHQRAAAWVGGLTAAAFFGTEALLPLTLTSLHKRTLVEAGAVLTVAALTWTLGSWLQARLFHRWGPRRLTILAVALIGSGVATTLAVDWAANPWWLAFLAWGLAPAGMGVLVPMMSLIVVAGDSGLFGEPLASLQVLVTLGTALGTGIAGAALVWASRLAADIAPGLRAFDLLAAVTTFAALAAVAGLPSKPSAKAEGGP